MTIRLRVCPIYERDDIFVAAAAVDIHREQSAAPAQHAMALAQHARLVRYLLQRAGTIHGVEGQLTRRDASQVDVEVASILVNFGGQPATLSIARDISARKELMARAMEMSGT